MAVYFTSDLHIGHENIIKYCDRPFATVEEMDARLLANWRTTITPEDEVYFLGDFCLRAVYVPLLAELPFKHMHFLEGNHDPMPKLMALKDPRVEFHKDLTLELDGRKFFLTHSPMQASPSLPTICGHVHDNWTFLKAGQVFNEFHKAMVVKKKVHQPVLNVSVDVHAFAPITLERVLAFFQ